MYAARMFYCKVWWILCSW